MEQEVTKIEPVVTDKVFNIIMEQEVKHDVKINDIDCGKCSISVNHETKTITFELTQDNWDIYEDFISKIHLSKMGNMITN